MIDMRILGRHYPTFSIGLHQKYRATVVAENVRSCGTVNEP
jgi:hypothetical protein